MARAPACLTQRLRRQLGTLIFEKIETPAICFQAKTLNANTKITIEKVFQINATAPGMICFEVAIVLPVLRGKSVSPPKANVPFRVAVPFRAGRRNDFLSFFP